MILKDCVCVFMRSDIYGGQRHWIPLDLNLQAIVNHLKWVLRPNLGPLQEQYIFLTTASSLQLSHI